MICSHRFRQTINCYHRPRNVFPLLRHHLHTTRSPVISDKVLIEGVKDGFPSFVQHTSNIYVSSRLKKSLAEQKHVKRIYPILETVPSELHGKLTRSLYDSFKITKNERDFAETVPDQFIGRIIRIYSSRAGFNA